ncbi:TetR/AcrR family transcriptional regulator [Mycobacterium hubeiense]|uniref:TetR/AcrR family transcriptional regulator n=1 Tax=Mycobacterium hubeiense TaxID=1867256 RepID=UPI000C7F6ED7|nr:TetR/AcrR family transcriptional regulator [Mycobacterium sp. QGD 101]
MIGSVNRATSPGRPVGASGEETRRRIIDATCRCVADVGYSQATIREIARMAQVTSATLYHYFPNKAELIKAAVAEMSAMVLPRLTDAVDAGDGVLDKLTAILDECERINRDYPYAAAFERAIRAENARELHLGDSAETGFADLRALIAGVMRQGKRDGALGPDVDVHSASNAVLTLIRGMNEFTTMASASEYHSTLRALKALVRGAMFDYRKLTS